MATDKTQEETDATNNANSHSYHALAYARFANLARPFAYSNEVGEAFAHTFPKALPLSYALAFTYVGADIGFQTYLKKGEGRDAMIRTGVEATVWHGIGSIVVPTFTVKAIVYSSKKFIDSRNVSPFVKKAGPAGIALACIPFIIKPIDRFADWVVDAGKERLGLPKTVRSGHH